MIPKNSNPVCKGLLHRNLINILEMNTVIIIKLIQNSIIQYGVRFYFLAKRKLESTDNL